MPDKTYELSCYRSAGLAAPKIFTKNFSSLNSAKKHAKEYYEKEYGSWNFAWNPCGNQIWCVHTDKEVVFEIVS